jgi:hypothetical protein
VGFHYEALEIIQLLSGLVKVREVVWQEEQKVLIFIVENIDKTGTLFRRGSLVATPIFKYQVPTQELLVSSPGTKQALQDSGCIDESQRCPS